MSLLQETLDKIEARATKESAIVMAHADSVRELESIIKTLSYHGAVDLNPVITAHEHTQDVRSDAAIDTRILVFQEQADTVRALDKSMLGYTLECGQDGLGRPRTTVRIEGMSVYIELIDYSPLIKQAA